MSNPPKAWVSQALTAAAQNKKVLAVEGKYDRAVVMPWLEKQLGPTWTNSIHLEDAAGNRGALLDGLEGLIEKNDPLRAHIFALADRDEWESADVSKLQARLPTLLVNQSRHSLESYFCDGDELSAILRARDIDTGAAVFTPRLDALTQQMRESLKDHVPHWALSRVIQQANEHIRNDAAYPQFFKDKCPLPSDDSVKMKLLEWSRIVNADDLFAAFDELRKKSLGESAQVQFRSCVEPKLFFGAIVVSGPNGLNSILQKSKEDWMIELARWSPAMPADLQTTLAPVLT